MSWPNDEQWIADRRERECANAYNAVYTTHLILRGRTTNLSDPKANGDLDVPIKKFCRVEALAETLVRWSALGRVIVSAQPTSERPIW